MLSRRAAGFFVECSGPAAVKVPACWKYQSLEKQTRELVPGLPHLIRRFARYRVQSSRFSFQIRLIARYRPVSARSTVEPIPRLLHSVAATISPA
jgi:hypothetical protein